MPEGALELDIERMVHGGAALARKPGGEVVLVTGAIPGERVLARLEQKRGVWLGRTLDVLRPAPERVPTPAHPGLDYGFMTYRKQLELKREVVLDSLRRAAAAGDDLPEVPPVRPSVREWGYRDVIQPAVSDAGLGYRWPGSGDVLVLGEDPTATDAVNAAWSVAVQLRAHRAVGARELVIRANQAGEALIAIVTTAPERKLIPLAHALVRAGIVGVVSAPFDPRGRFRRGVERLAGQRTISQRLGAFELTVNASSFAQPNSETAARMYGALVEWAGSGGHAWELFAGGGAIAFHLAQNFEAVTAVEMDRGAIARGEGDAERLGLGNVRFVRADARTAPLPSDADVLVMDPPRAGLSADLRAAIGASGIPRLLYVSCDVATWSRDVVDLGRRGYTLTRSQPYDFYPQTHHIEMLSELVLDRN